jgi:hypothetical protein
MPYLGIPPLDVVSIDILLRATLPVVWSLQSAPIEFPAVVDQFDLRADLRNRLPSTLINLSRRSAGCSLRRLRRWNWNSSSVDIRRARFSYETSSDLVLHLWLGVAHRFVNFLLTIPKRSIALVHLGETALMFLPVGA